VKDHEKDVKEFEEEAKDGSDADVKAWANKTLPTLKKHLELAKEIQGKLK
jgi:putative membrane protein